MQVSYTIWLTDRGYNRPNDHESTGENSPKPGRGTEAVEPEKEVSHSMTFWLVKNRIPWMGNTSSSREPKVALTRFCLGTRSLFTALSLFGTCLFHREQEVRLQILRIADQAQVQAAHFPKRRCLASTHFVPLNNTTCFVCRNQKPGIANTRIGRLREFYDATLNKLDSLVGFPFFKATKLVSERMVWGWVVSLRGSRFKPEQKWPRDAWLEFGCPESKPSDLAPTMEFNKKTKLNKSHWATVCHGGKLQPNFGASHWPKFLFIIHPRHQQIQPRGDQLIFSTKLSHQFTYKARENETYPLQKPIDLTWLDFWDLGMLAFVEAGEEVEVVQPHWNKCKLEQCSMLPCFHAHKKQLPIFCQGHLVRNNQN